jgi:transposase
MLTQEEDVELSALHRQGWTISAIARHLGRDRATIRRYLRGEVVPGQRRRARPDALDPYVSYLAPGSAMTRTSGPPRCSTRGSGG